MGRWTYVYVIVLTVVLQIFCVLQFKAKTAFIIKNMVFMIAAMVISGAILVLVLFMAAKSMVGLCGCKQEIDEDNKSNGGDNGDDVDIVAVIGNVAESNSGCDEDGENEEVILEMETIA